MADGRWGQRDHETTGRRDCRTTGRNEVQRRTANSESFREQAAERAMADEDRERTSEEKLKLGKLKVEMLVARREATAKIRSQRSDVRGQMKS